MASNSWIVIILDPLKATFEGFFYVHSGRVEFNLKLCKLLI